MTECLGGWGSLLLSLSFWFGLIWGHTQPAIHRTDPAGALGNIWDPRLNPDWACAKRTPLPAVRGSGLEHGPCCSLPSPLFLPKEEAWV